MIQQVIIDNFKIHKHTELNLTRLNVLTGINSCGKSSAIQALLLLRQNQQKGLLTQGLELNGDLYNLGLAEDAICQYSGDDHIGFRICWTDETTAFWKFKPIGNNTKKDFIPIEEAGSRSVGDKNLFSTDFQYISAFRLPPQESYPLNTNAVEIKRQLSLEKGQCELVVHFLYYYGKEKLTTVPAALWHPECKESDLLSQVSAWEGRISPGVNVLPKMNGKSFELRYSYNLTNSITTSAEFSAENVGFGLSYALPIIAALLTSNEKSLLIIENPEAHLHPSGQAELARLIAISAQNGAQIIVETHSDHIINGILVACKQFEEQKGGIDRKFVHFLNFTKVDDTQVARVETIHVLEDGKINKQPEGFFDQTEKDLSYLLGF